MRQSREELTVAVQKPYNYFKTVETIRFRWGMLY